MGEIPESFQLSTSDFYNAKEGFFQSAKSNI